VIRFLLALTAGFVAGVLLFAMLVYFNPITAKAPLSPLLVGSNEIISLSYSLASDDAIVYTNNGESRVAPSPDRVQQLWERPIKRSAARTVVVHDAAGNEAGIGFKFSSDSEASRLANGEAFSNSVWHVYLPGRGTFFMEQVENRWHYVRDIVLPAYWSSADSWKGNWNSTITAGPGALGTGRVTGGSGEFDGLVTAGIESLSARAFSLSKGPVAIEGQLTIEVGTDLEVETDLEFDADDAPGEAPD
jgi:hypothetical protein